jgi:hypothetical protein
MALYYDQKPISQVHWKSKSIAAIYYGAQLVWEAIRSCFGSGMWIRKKPWLYKEGWRKTKKY